MPIYPLMTFLGISKTLPSSAQGLIQKFLILASLHSTFFFVSGTFYVLYVLDKVSYFELGILVAIAYLIQAGLDYPSGAIGDWIGQRWILTIAFLSYSISYGLLVFSDSFSELLLVYGMGAFAGSQESGALQAWFDNNYKTATIADKKFFDPDRTIYQLFQGKINMILGLLWAFSILIGGILATLFLREFVFALQSIGMLFLSSLCFLHVKDLPGTKDKQKSFKNYFNLLGKGIKFAFTKKYMFYFLIGLCFLNAIWSVWGQMILFPMYYGYTGSDIGAGIFRFLAWINQSLTASYAGKVSTKLKVGKIPLLEWCIMFGYFSYFALLIFIFPLKNILNLFAIILTLVVFSILDFCVNILVILRQRLYLDMIPDDIRNSIYSLIPTVSLLLSAPVIAIAGSGIELVGLSITLVSMAIFGSFSVIIMFLAFRYMPSRLLQNNLTK